MGEVTNTRAGIALPTSGGSRSTVEFAKAVLADAVRKHDADLSQAIEASRRWRSEYIGAFRSLTAVSASAPDAALGIAKDGLTSARGLLRNVKDGRDSALSAQLWRSGDATFGAETVQGTGTPATSLRIPFRGNVLEGDALRRQLADWEQRGIVEPSFVTAIEKVIDNPKWLSLPGFQTVIVGAAAEMGPYLPLIGWGADIFAVDLPKPEIWTTLLAAAKVGAGSVTYPTSPVGPGLDIARDFPALLQWIYANTGKRKKLVFGMYASADNGDHIEASAAADVVGEDIIGNRSNATLAYLASPTDCFMVKADVMAEARRRWHERGIKSSVQDVLRLASRSALFRPNYLDEVVDFEGNHWGLANTLMSAQGPDYAFAKRLQRWRGVVTRAAGQGISFSVAPASWTRSVTVNRSLAAAFHGAGPFGVEIFAPSTARMLMAAKLVSDLCAPTPESPNANPEELFYEGAAHGGLWRQPFEPVTALGIAAAAGYPRALFE